MYSQDHKKFRSVGISMLLIYCSSRDNSFYISLFSTCVADPHRKNADADPGKNLNADPDADANSCPY